MRTSRIYAALLNNEPVIEIKDELNLVCETDPNLYNLVDGKNICLRALWEHMQDCPCCGPLNYKIGPLFLLTRHDIEEWFSSYKLDKQIEIQEDLALEPNYRLTDKEALFRGLMILRQIGQMPFELRTLPFLFLWRLYMENIPDSWIAQLLATTQDVVARRRNLFGIVYGPNAGNIVYELLKELAIDMLRQGKTTEAVCQATGIDIKSLRIIKGHMGKKGCYR